MEIITEKMFPGFKNYTFFLKKSINFHVFEHCLTKWFVISNPSFASHLRDIPKLVELKAKKIKIKST